MQYGEPFTHTGVLATYAANSNWTVMGGAVTGSSTGGWDGNWDRDLGNWAWLGGVTWTSDDAGTSLAVTSTAGDRSESYSDSWAMYSIVGKYSIRKIHDSQSIRITKPDCPVSKNTPSIAPFIICNHLRQVSIL